MKRWLILIVVAVLLVIGGVTLVKLRKHQLESIRIATKLAVPVETATVRQGTFIHWQPYIGHLESNRQGVIKARLTGQVSRILKREGQMVKPGEPVMELDGTPNSPFGTRKALQASVASQRQAVQNMEKSVKNLEAIVARDRDLYAHKAISKQALEVSENNLQAARVQLSSLKTGLASLQEKLSFLTVRAPFEGTISQVKVNEGDVVMPSQVVMELEDATPCKVKSTVSTDDLTRLKVGAPVQILYDGQQLDAVLTRVYPSAKDAGVGTVEVELPEPPFGLPLGATVSVNLPIQQIPDALMLPVGAVLTSADTATVFRIENGKVHPVTVRVIGESAEGFAVSGKLKDGDLAVRGSDSLLMRLAEGTPVKRLEANR